MPIDDFIENLLDRHRMNYPCYAVKDIDLPTDIKYLLMFVGEFDVRYPRRDISVVRRILEHSPRRWYSTISNDGTYIGSIARQTLRTDEGFRDNILTLYERILKPEIERYKSYNGLINQLKYEFVDMMSYEDVQKVGDLYREYRKLNGADKLSFLMGVDLQYLHIINSMKRIDERYHDIIDKDLGDVCDKVFESVGIDKKAGLDRKEYGILFPYLYMFKMLHKYSDDRFYYMDFPDFKPDYDVPDFSYKN